MWALGYSSRHTGGGEGQGSPFECGRSPSRHSPVLVAWPFSWRGLGTVPKSPIPSPRDQGPSHTWEECERQERKA